VTNLNETPYVEFNKNTFTGYGVVTKERAHRLEEANRGILCAFAKIAKSHYNLRHICPFVRMEELGSHWTDFHEI